MPGHKTHPSKTNPRLWRALKAQAWIEAQGKPTCPRCGKPITGPLKGMDLGHQVDYATAQPGETNPLQLEHPACNRRAGQLLGDEMKRQRKQTPQEWITTEITRT